MTILREHACNSEFKWFKRLFGLHFSESCLSETAHILRVSVVDFWVLLTSCCNDLLDISNNHIVSSIHMRWKCWLVLAYEFLSNKLSKSPKRQTSRINKKPLACRCFWKKCFHKKVIYTTSSRVTSILASPARYLRGVIRVNPEVLCIFLATSIADLQAASV